MNDITREYLLRKAMGVKYLVRESGNGKKCVTGIATEFHTCKDGRYLILSCLSFRSADEAIADIEALKAKLASDEKVMAHVFASYIPCSTDGEVIMDLDWLRCKDFKFDKFLKGYTLKLYDL